MDEYLSTADAARLLGVVPATVRQMERRGTLRLAAKTAGGIRLFRYGDVDRLAKRRAKQKRDGPAKS